MGQLKRKANLIRKKGLAGFLTFVMLLMTAGCASDAGTDPVAEEKILIADYRQFTTDETLLEMIGLLSDHYAYIAGIRQTPEATGMETAIYRMGWEEEELQLIATYPDEKILQWCMGENGQIGILSSRMRGADTLEREYVLHLLEEESLTEQTCTLEGKTDFSRDPAMALREGEMAVTDSMGKEVAFFDSTTGVLQKSIATEETPLYLAYQGDKLTGISGSGSMYLYDSKTGSRKKTTEGLFGETGTVRYGAIYEKEVLLATGSGLYSVTLKDLGCTQVADYLEYDILPGDGLAATENAATGDYQLLTWSNAEGRAEICRLRSVSGADAEAAEKEVILLSFYSRNFELQDAVVAFNKSSDKYRIEIEWGEESGDYIGYWNTVWTALMTGGGPDLLSVSQQMNFNDYIRQGMLEDLTPYIEADLNPEDYVESALYAYRQGDSVYGLMGSFVLNTQITKQSLFTESGTGFETGMGWTFEEMAAAAAANPQIKAYKENTDALEVLRDCVFFGGIAYNDYETLSQAILFAERYGKGLAPGEEAVLGENVLVADVQLNIALNWADIQALYGDDIVVAGFPRNDRQGVAQSGIAWSINRNSGHKEGAWAFLRFLLSGQYQERRAGGFSVYRDIFEKELMKYSEPDSYQLYLPEAGGIITITNTYHLPASGLEIEAMTQDQIETVRKLAENSEVYEFSEDDGAWNIIYEEAGAYFAGDRTIEKTMEILQNRMDVYLSEKRE